MLEIMNTCNGAHTYHIVHMLERSEINRKKKLENLYGYPGFIKGIVTGI